MSGSPPELLIRPESPEDADTIYALTQQAFADMPFSDGDEGALIGRLREAGSLSLPLVAVLDQRIVGQVTFSPAQFSDGSQPWFALGPVSVLPALQGQHIGSALIEEGLDQLRQRNALGCILTGNPNYYQRFGFESAAECAPAAEPAEYFMVRTLLRKPQQGTFAFHPAFYAEGDRR